MTGSSPYWREPLFYLAALTLLAGIYFRFTGLGYAPFAVDEYYLARSIEGVLHAGVPSFVCGGLYMRGIVLQYSAAAVQLAGASAEFAPRFICALASLLCLPAVFILGNRVQGRTVGYLAVALCALSVWEIEIARFGRMYAPFQAVFLWYMVFFLRYTADRDKRALWPMIGLSAIAPLVWEGGIFLALANLLSLFLRRWPERLRRNDWIYLISCTALLGLVYWFLAADFRGYRADSWPAGYSTSMSVSAPDAVTTLKLPLSALRQHGAWIALGVVPLVAFALGLRRVWELRARRFLTLGLLGMLLAAMAHQLLAVFAIATLLLLTRLASWGEFFGRRLGPVHTAIALSTLFWIVFAVFSADWHRLPVSSLAGRTALLAYQFLHVPDVIAVVVRPWARAVPHLGAGLLLLTGVSIFRTARGQETPEYERVLLIVFVVLILAASGSKPPREETRYVFFLYPVALVIGLATIARVITYLMGPRTLATAVSTAVALGGFALSEDFQPRHLLNIDSSPETFRLNMPAAMQEHLIIRTDYRAIAQWLQDHKSDQTTVINGVHGLDHYYTGIDYFYVDETSPNFPDWSCRQGTVERWGNYPLLYTVDALAQKVAAKPVTYLVSFSYDQDLTLASLAALHPKVAMSNGDVIVIELRG